MIMKRASVIICCIIFTCLSLNGCTEEDYLLRRGNREAESRNYEAAIKFYSEALKINPRNADLYYNRGLVWNYMNEIDKAIADYTTALEINKEFINAYFTRGSTLRKKGDYDLAISDFTKALQFNPDNSSKAGLYFNRAYAWFKKGDYERAIGDYTEGIRIIEAMKVDPKKKTEAYYARAEVWYEKGDFDNAISDYTKAIEINPKYAQAVFSRANTWHEKRNYASAVIDYERAAELDPQNAVVYNNYSWLLSTCPDSKFRDGAKALKLAQKAVAINPDEAFFLSTLSAAYAELGNFKEAVQTVEKAILLLKKNNKENLKDILIPQLESYKAEKPWREDVKREDWMLKYEIEKGK
ncbi:MAG: tetratricopeptide repeat protein [Nitrospirae bacterium]|nr:tetratricopeptide repeat protein [Nitrospirota bacterium]